jgi:hypothetical protein
MLFTFCQVHSDVCGVVSNINEQSKTYPFLGFVNSNKLFSKATLGGASYGRAAILRGL